jgi:hypothetical protein
MNAKITSAVAALIIAGCSPAPSSMASRNSRVDFIPADGFSSLVDSVKKPSFTVCLQGSIGNDFELWQTNIQKAILAWVQPLRSLTSVPLVSEINVEVIDGPCDATVVVTPGQHALTNMGRNPQVNMNNTGQFSTYNTLLHEFGHGFGLYDTYQNGLSGDCQPGQPQAVMCNTSFSGLEKDDIAGVQDQFKQTYPNDVPGNDSNTPPAVDGNTTLRINAAVEHTSQLTADNSFQIFMTASLNNIVKSGRMEYCIGSQLECTANKFIGTTQKSTGFYYTPTRIPISDGTEVTIRFSGVDSDVISTVVFHRT